MRKQSLSARTQAAASGVHSGKAPAAAWPPRPLGAGLGARRGAAAPGSSSKLRGRTRRVRPRGGKQGSRGHAEQRRPLPQARCPQLAPNTSSTPSPTHPHPFTHTHTTHTNTNTSTSTYHTHTTPPAPAHQKPQVVLCQPPQRLHVTAHGAVKHLVCGSVRVEYVFVHACGWTCARMRWQGHAGVLCGGATAAPSPHCTPKAIQRRSTTAETPAPPYPIQTNISKKPAHQLLLLLQLEDALLDGAADDKARHAHRLELAQTVDAVLSLLLHRRVPAGPRAAGGGPVRSTDWSARSGGEPRVVRGARVKGAGVEQEAGGRVLAAAQLPLPSVPAARPLTTRGP